MSYKSISSGVNGRPKKQPVNISYSRHKPLGLDKNTVLEGSAIDTPSLERLEICSSKDLKPRLQERNNDSERWKDKYISLQKTVQSLRKELKFKESQIIELKDEKQRHKLQLDTEMETLQKSLREQEKTSKTNIEELKAENKQMFQEKELNANNLKELTEKIQSLQQLHSNTLSTMLSEHKKELKSLSIKNIERIEQIKTNHGKVIVEKDQTIEKLKKQIGESLNQSSKERQAQIDDLVKELKRVSEEAEYVKNALRKFKSINTDDCSRCNMYQEKFKDMSLELTRKNSICQNLFTVCSKMEKQLQQKKDLMEIWNTVKAAK